jgi:threonine aldolase
LEPIDLRSDTVTRPTLEMRQVLAQAPVGDDVYGEDPSVNNLEKFAAHMTGTESALFATSGTQSNLLALLSHCERGDEYIVGQEAHTYKFEGGGAAVLGSIQPQPLDLEKDGTLDLIKVARTIKPDDCHFARTRLLCLENTHNGKVLPMGYLKQAEWFAKQHDLGLHLDGARLFNAAVKLKVDVRSITRHFDTVSVCLSKGLGAPAGSVLCGPTALIVKARRWRKVLGGGMRQAGILASAGQYALEHHVDRLSDDHANATYLAQGLSQVRALEIDLADVQTNMVFVRCAAGQSEALSRFLSEKGILITPGTVMRLVTHLDVQRSDMDTVIESTKEFFSRQQTISMP